MLVLFLMSPLVRLRRYCYRHGLHQPRSLNFLLTDLPAGVLLLSPMYFLYNKPGAPNVDDALIRW